MKPAYVVVGILLLAATFIGAKMAFDQSAAANHKTKTDAEANLLPKEILCWGYFDVESGVAGLDPRQYGDVTMVLPENTHVKAGDVLLQIDDKVGRLKVEEAKAAVKAAEQQFAEAKHLTRFYELQRVQQKAVIAALDHERNLLEQKRDRELQTLPDDKSPIAVTIKRFYVEGLAQLDEKKKAEEAKLEQLKLQDAELKILQAEADLEAKNVRLKQARETLNYFKIAAPKAGIVLRVNVRQGETLGPNPMRHAIEFLPKGDLIVKAEVLQEWGRLVKVGQEVTIEDDTYHGQKWQGTIKSISEWYAPTRSPVIEPFRYNDVRTLECIIAVKDSDSKARIGQRVRAKVKVD